MKEAVILHLINKPHHIHQMSIVTEDTVEEDRRNSTLQLLQSFLRLTANLLMPEEIIGNKYPLMQIFLQPHIELVQSIFLFRTLTYSCQIVYHHSQTKAYTKVNTELKLYLNFKLFHLAIITIIVKRLNGKLKNSAISSNIFCLVKMLHLL